MGSADLYCSICGGPTYSRNIITNILLLKKFLTKGKYFNLKPDGVWENAELVIEIYQKKKINKMSNDEYNKLIKSIKIPKLFDSLLFAI